MSATDIFIMAIVWIIPMVIPSAILGRKIWKEGEKIKALAIFISGSIVPFIGWPIGILLLLDPFTKVFAKVTDSQRVFIPEGKRINFPSYCIHCLNPSTETKQLEKKIQSTSHDTDFLARKTTTTTRASTGKIAGIPYCSACSSLSTQISKALGRTIWISVLFAIAVGIIYSNIDGTEYAGNRSFFISIAAFVVLFALLGIHLRVKFPDYGKHGIGKSNDLGIQLQLSKEVKNVDGLGVYLTFFNIDYAKKFIEANITQASQEAANIA